MRRALGAAADAVLLMAMLVLIARGAGEMLFWMFHG